MARFFEASSQEVLSFVLIKLPLQEDCMGAPWGSLKEVSPGSSSFVGLTLTIPWLEIHPIMERRRLCFWAGGDHVCRALDYIWPPQTSSWLYPPPCSSPCDILLWVCSPVPWTRNSFLDLPFTVRLLNSGC